MEVVVVKKEEIGGNEVADVEEKTVDVTYATVGCKVVDEEVEDEEVEVEDEEVEDEGDVATVGRVNVEEVEETGNGRRDPRS